jgi:hypothetical protein
VTERDPLWHHAETFADELTRTTQAVAPSSSPFRAIGVSDRLVVRQDPTEGIPLTVEGEVLMYLKANFHCTWDRGNEYLTVEKSGISVYAMKPSGQPIIRYEYERTPRGVPASHMHVHAHRDSLTYMMARAGVQSRRAESRVTSREIPSFQDLHLPLGGHRFRPALEDVLEMLIDEFGVDHEEGAIRELRDARERWRLTQTRAAVRDAPHAAVDVLRSLGYAVEWAGGGDEPQPRLDRLHAR